MSGRRAAIGIVGLLALLSVMPYDAGPLAARAEPSPLGRRPVLTYLLREEAALDALAAAAHLTPAQRAAVRAAVAREAAAQRALIEETRPVVADPLTPAAEKRQRVEDRGYNARVQASVAATAAELRQALDEGQYRAVEDWVATAWREEAARHGGPNAVVAAPSMGTLYQRVQVFATWFHPSPGDPLDEVALPDKYLKFANRGWRSLLPPTGYAGSDYRVQVLYKGRSARALVYDVGPWNLDDVYWSNGPNDSQPRRLFADLPPGLPEAQAAFFQCGPAYGYPDGVCYNDGKDQFGRTVLNPAAVDFGPAIRDAVGLPGADWVYLLLLWRDVPASYAGFLPRVGR